MMTSEKPSVRMSRIVVAMAMLMLPVAAHAAAFTNGGFETPDVTTGAPGTSGDISGIAPWTFDETSGDQIQHYDGSFYGAISAQEGDQYAGFTSNGSTDGGIMSQAFDTNIGTTYTVSFWASNVWFQTGEEDSHSLIVAVDNTGGDGVTATPAVNGQAVGIWEQFTFNFLASATTTTLSFTSVINSGPSTSADILLDNVSVAVYVPSPAALPAGLVAMGLLAARRRR